MTNELNRSRLNIARCDLENSELGHIVAFHDSGEITVGDLAAFIGRNESGKTTILQALTLLNRGEQVSELDLCDEMSDELKDEIRLAEGEFELNQQEMEMVKEKFPGLPEMKKLDCLEQIKT